MKAQSSIEFAMIISIVVLMFTIFLLFYNQQMGEAETRKNNQMIEDLGAVIKNEVELANAVTKGYQRSFFLPKELMGKLYQINYVNGSMLDANFTVMTISLNSENSYNHIIFLPPKVEGELKYGENNITKNDVVCFNC